MKLLFLIFLFLSYGIFVTLYNSGESPTAPDFPQFNAPNITFQDLPAHCSGIIDCTAYIGNVLINIVLGIIFFVLLIVAMLVFIVALVALFAASGFNGIEGAPDWFNALVLGVLGAAFGIMIYRSLRKGDTSA